MAVEVFMPKMSDHMEAGEIVEWHVEEGAEVERGQVILEVMTDKVVAELEAPAAGVLKGIRSGAVAGAIIPVGETFAFIAESDEEVEKLPPLVAPEYEESEPEPSAEPMHETAVELEPARPDRVRAAPLVRRVAQELDVDLEAVEGTGPGGRITEEDVRAFADAGRARPTRRDEPVGASPIASPMARRVASDLGVELAEVEGTAPGGRIRVEDVEAFAKRRPGEGTPPAEAEQRPGAQASAEDFTWLDLTSIQRRTGERMVESVQTAPQFTLAAEVDATNLLWLRDALMAKVEAETGERLSITALVVKIVAAALEAYPRANASFEDGRIKLFNRINVGVAVGTEDGLVVPVIRDANQQSVIDVTRQLQRFREKAQQMRFSSEDLSVGTFTISNLGMYGVDRFDAIVNPPQSAILAVGQVVKKPVGLADDTLALRPTLNLSLSVDHRSLDGIQAAQLLAEIRQRIEEPYFLL